MANFVFRRNMQASAPGVWPSLTYLFQFYQSLHGMFALDLLTWVFGCSGILFYIFYSHSIWEAFMLFYDSQLRT